MPISDSTAPPPTPLSPEARGAVSSGLNRLALAINPAPAMRLEDYFVKIWEILEPSKPLIRSWHLGYLCEHLEAVSLGQITRLLINVPPRTAKSSLVSIGWPTWQWGPFSRPENRFMFISHEISLALDLAVSRRAVIESDWFREQFPKVILASDQNEKKLVQNTRRGKYIATSTHGAATGKGGDFLVPDDFIDPEKSESDVEREAALKAWDLKFSSRLDNKITGAIVAIEQRTHPKDFTNKLVEAGGYTHLVIPSDNYKKEPMRYRFLKSEKEVVIEPGEAVLPDIKPLAIVLQERREKGSRTHDTQERQNPPAEGGVIFKRANWRFYDDLDVLLWKIDPATGARVLKSWDEILQSWDCAFKETETSDFVVGQVWGRRGADRWLLDQFKEQTGIGGTMKAIASMSEKWPRAMRKLIEDKANGPAVIELLKTKVPGLIAVEPEGGKIVRARAVEPIQEAGNLWLPSPKIAPWIEDFIANCAKFPNVEHDDEVDAMTQANIYFTAHGGPKMTIG